jgi:type I restriction enzyme, S subunit
MRIDTFHSSEFLDSGRLDSAYYLSAGRHAIATLDKARRQGLVFRRLGQQDGIANVWQPNRFKRVYAASREEKLPYLRPYDIFEFLPIPADFLSAKRSENIDSYRLKRGMLLQSCSGRNLGPAVFVDSYLTQFVLSHDILRIEIADEALRYYVLVFLKSSLGQAMLRQQKTGSVIDHISVEHIVDFDIPVLSEPDFTAVSRAMREACDLKEKARLTLADVQKRYEDALPKLNRRSPMSSGWTVKSRNLTGRLDASSYDPLVASVRTALLRIGGKRVDEVATVLKPPGRYKTTYVSANHGTPILSGTQLLQHTPINLQYLAARALTKRNDYEVHADWLAYQADGRAEETLGLPVMITPDRDGWLASGHVGRVVANDGINQGWLCAALRTAHCQIQIKSLASGSVVDSTFPSDMASVILPPSTLDTEWDRVVEAWHHFAQVTELENRAIRLLEKRLTQSELKLI